MTSRFVSKSVNYKFNGAKLNFDLSYALFSSFDIDKGSHFLLKTVARQGVVEDGASVLDLGCGIGTLGLSVLAAYPNVKLSIMDRDALAVDFTLDNAKKNGLKVSKAFYGLAFDGVEDSYDLVLANIPAKAGVGAITSMLKNSVRVLNGDGLCCIVVVKTLAALVSDILVELKYSIVYAEKSEEYSVFHFNGGSLKSIPDVEFKLSDYFRSVNSFSVSNFNYTLQTVYNLPNFDNLSYGLKLAIGLLPDREFGKAVFVDPGQGHLPLVYLKKVRSCRTLFLISRDALQLKISEYNIKRYFPDLDIRLIHCSDISKVNFGNIRDCFVSLPIYKIANYDYCSFAYDSIDSWCGENSSILVWGKATIFSKHPKCLNLVKSKKNHGFKVLSFKK